MSKRIKIGILGCANIAERFVIPALLELDDKFDVIGVASRTEAKADKFCKKFNITPYVGYENLIDDELEAIYIPLPNGLHFEWIKKALKRGLHVISEKSLACSYAEVAELNNIAREKGLVLLENFQFRFHSQLEYIKNIVSQNQIGELRNVRSSFGFPPFIDKDNIRYSQKLGGGALLDAGAYTLKISQIFLGENIQIASSSLSLNHNNIDIWGSGSLTQVNGSLTSQVSFGFDNFYQCNIELWGTKGKVYTNRIFTAPPGYKPTIEIETKYGKEEIVLNDDNHFKRILEYFYQMIKSKNDFEFEYQQNVNQARLLNEFREKAYEK